MSIEIQMGNPVLVGSERSHMDGNDCDIVVESESIGHQQRSQAEKHKEISKRFKHLLNLFERYTRRMKIEQCGEEKALKRTQSEMFSCMHKQTDADSGELVKATISLPGMQLSDSTLLSATPPHSTMEASIQTASWPGFGMEKKLRLKDKLKKSQKIAENARENETQYMLHIEVDSDGSETALQRAPFRQRLCQVVIVGWRALQRCFYIMGENLVYVLFIGLCMWCLYLILTHFNYMRANMNHKTDLHHPLISARASHS